MWLILTEPCDETGAWLADGLRAFAPCPLARYTTRDIAHGARTARVVEGGDDWFQISVDHRATIDSRTLRGVVNRVCALPPGLAFRLQSPHREYAERNFGLPLLQLLHHFNGPVLNRPTAQGISGDFRLDFEWAALASQVGFPRATSRLMWAGSRADERKPEDRDTPDIVSVAVIGDQVVPLTREPTLLPGATIASCRRLAALSRTTLLGLDLLKVPSGEWQFFRANPRTNLIPGGDAVLAAIARALTSQVAAEISSLENGPGRAAAGRNHGAPV